VSIQKLSHAHLRVDDLDQALEFHTDVLGLTQLAREGNTVFLGCGLDNNYDVALTPGGTGLAQMAFDVTSSEDLDRYGQRLAAAGVEVERRGDAEPGVDQALRFNLPSGHVMELVVLSEPVDYQRVHAPVTPRHGVAPLDADHITLQVPPPVSRPLVEFLRGTLDFHISDIFEPEPGLWAAAWTRTSDQHHDLAWIPPSPEAERATLHHFAWRLDGIEDMKRGADRLSTAGIPIEVGPGRHGAGSNLFTYFRAPGGNRYEFSAEMARTTNRAAEPSMISGPEFPRAFSAWGQVPPESFAIGS
jgi:catechol 2,3-dioxygenase